MTTCKTCGGTGKVTARSASTGEWESDVCLDCEGAAAVDVTTESGRRSYWKPGDEPLTAVFELGDYLRDTAERERKERWERTFGRKEKF